jgi:hypothetical protein
MMLSISCQQCGHLLASIRNYRDHLRDHLNDNSYALSGSNSHFNATGEIRLGFHAVEVKRYVRRSLRGIF